MHIMDPSRSIEVVCYFIYKRLLWPVIKAALICLILTGGQDALLFCTGLA